MNLKNWSGPLKNVMGLGLIIPLQNMSFRMNYVPEIVPDAF